MAEENPESGEECIDEDVDFNIYYRVAKQHALKQLPEITDSSKACAWLLKIKNCPDKKLRLDYVRLLVFALYLKKMIGPFEARPPKEDLQPFPEGVDVLKIGRDIIRQVTEERVLQPRTAEVATTLSWDKREYAAHQLNNGCAQCFYAVSSAPFEEWVGYEGEEELASKINTEFDLDLALDELAKCGNEETDKNDDNGNSPESEESSESSESSDSEDKKTDGSDKGEGGQSGEGNDKAVTVRFDETVKGETETVKEEEQQAPKEAETEDKPASRHRKLLDVTDPMHDQKWLANFGKFVSVIGTKYIPESIETKAGVINESNRIMDLYSGCSSPGNVDECKMAGHVEDKPEGNRSGWFAVGARCASTPTPSFGYRRPASPTSFLASPVYRHPQSDLAKLPEEYDYCMDAGNTEGERDNGRDYIEPIQPEVPEECVQEDFPRAFSGGPSRHTTNWYILEDVGYEIDSRMTPQVRRPVEYVHYRHAEDSSERRGLCRPVKTQVSLSPFLNRPKGRRNLLPERSFTASTPVRGREPRAECLRPDLSAVYGPGMSRRPRSPSRRQRYLDMTDETDSLHEEEPFCPASSTQFPGQPYAQLELTDVSLIKKPYAYIRDRRPKVRSSRILF